MSPVAVFREQAQRKHLNTARQSQRNTKCIASSITNARGPYPSDSSPEWAWKPHPTHDLCRLMKILPSLDGHAPWEQGPPPRPRNTHRPDTRRQARCSEAAANGGSEPVCTCRRRMRGASGARPRRREGAGLRRRGPASPRRRRELREREGREGPERAQRQQGG